MNVKKRIFILVLCFFGLFSAFASGKKETIAELNAGKLKLRFYKKSGSFCLYRLSEIGKENWVPLYDDRALASTNRYSILIDGKIYPIKKMAGKSLNIEESADKIIVRFPLTKYMSVIQTFYFLEEKYETSEKVLCIETSFENTSGLALDVALKAIFDTSIGEKQRVALYTDAQAILSETRIDIANTSAKYLASANSISACLFFLKLENQKSPSEVFVANWDYLQSRKWTPTIVEGRSFSTKYYNNDSAIMLLWPSIRLNLNEKYVVTNYIGYYDYLKRDVPEAAIETHLQTLSEKERKSYDEVQALLHQVENVKQNPDIYSDEKIKALTEQVDSAMKKIQK